MLDGDMAFTHRPPHVPAATRVKRKLNEHFHWIPVLGIVAMGEETLIGASGVT